MAETAATAEQRAAQQRYPKNWYSSGDFDPNAHMMSLKGREYLNVQNRLQWFIADQRALIMAGLAQVPFVVRTDLVEIDRQAGYAHYMTYVRDVLGNEATMFGSETAKDFADFAEKASTKSLGRALLALGYGTAAAQDLDEGERVVDTPQPAPRRQPPAQQQQPQATQGQPQQQQPAPEPVSLDEAKQRLGGAQAPAQTQTALTNKLRTTLGTDQATVKRFILDVLGRVPDLAALKAGDSNITVAEVAKLELRLNEYASPAGQQAALDRLTTPHARP